MRTARLLKPLAGTLLLSTTFALSAFAGYEGPPGFLSEGANQKLFQKYCSSGSSKIDADSTTVPKPNYKNSLVNGAANKLNEVADISFYYYSGPLKAYGLKYGTLKKPNWVSKKTHQFMVQLCGEFRDRAKMIEAKLKWINKLNKLGVEPPKKQINPTKELWAQMTAHEYKPFIDFSRELFRAEENAVRDIEAKEGKFRFGEHSVRRPIPGLRVCKAEYIFHEFLTNPKRPASKDKSFPGLEEFNKGYEKFSRSKTGGHYNCTKADKSDYYDFRGDSNFKPYSPEANGMIWYATISTANHCKSTSKAKAKLSDKDCQNYFKNPFRSRYGAARASLGTWLLRSEEHDEKFSEDGLQLNIVPNREAYKGPFGFKYGGGMFGDEPSKNVLFDFLESFNAKYDWSKSDMGLNEIFDDKKGLAYERLRDAVNRHTDWYSSGYADPNSSLKEKAYSPFVASSYEIGESDNFAQPGTTVQSESDGRKHWMFVFRVKHDNWYNTNDLNEGYEIDIDTQWFDETSFGTNSLSQSERAWDRLGTAMEEELAGGAILYLHNITTRDHKCKRAYEVVPEDYQCSNSDNDDHDDDFFIE